MKLRVLGDKVCLRFPAWMFVYVNVELVSQKVGDLQIL